MLAAPLADFLRSRRDYCNARFAVARRRWPRLDGDDFSLFLRDQLGPLALAVEQAAPAHAHLVLDVAYDIGLQLVAEKLVGASADLRSPVNVLWSDLFPLLARQIATAPRRMLGGLTNIAHHLASTPRTRDCFWRSRLRELAPKCADAEQLLVLAQVLAWRAGLAHYRASALSVADTLPPEIALAALDAPAGAIWPEVRSAHMHDPWFGYAAGGTVPPSSTRTRRIGAFRGFDGLFITPPSVAVSGPHLLVGGGDEHWVLTADVFGATFHRAAPHEIAEAKPSPLTPALASLLPEGYTASGCAVNGSTYAVASRQSHSLWIGPVSEL